MKTLLTDIRMADVGDACAVSGVHRVSWLHTYAGLIPHKALNRMVDRRNDIWWRKAILGATSILVVELDGVIAGYATIGLSRARGLPQEGEIYEIYLRPEYQGVGLGRILFGEAKRLLKSLGCDGLVVWCLEECDQASRFFQSQGGVDIAEGMEDFADRKLRKIGFAWK